MSTKFGHNCTVTDLSEFTLPTVHQELRWIHQKEVVSMHLQESLRIRRRIRLCQFYQRPLLIARRKRTCDRWGRTEQRVKTGNQVEQWEPLTGLQWPATRIYPVKRDGGGWFISPPFPERTLAATAGRLKLRQTLNVGGFAGAERVKGCRANELGKRRLIEDADVTCAIWKRFDVLLYRSRKFASLVWLKFRMRLVYTSIGYTKSWKKKDPRL